MDDFLAACIAQNRLDVAGGSPGDLYGIHRIIGDKPARDLATIGRTHHDAITAIERAFHAPNAGRQQAFARAHR